MIALYSGTPGSGKSLHVAQKILNRLNTWHLPVIANFEINLDMIKKESDRDLFLYIPNNDLDPKYLVTFSRDYFGDKKVKEGEILLVIDECQLVFNCRDWQARDRSGWISFFSQHRKCGYDVILVAQFDRLIDRQIRSMIEYEYVHRKVSNFGWKGKFLSIATGNRLFVAIQHWYGAKERIASESFLYHKKNAELYNSYKVFETDKNILYVQPECEAN